MRGLLLKSFSEIWLPTLLFSLGLAAAMALLTTVLPHVDDILEVVFERIPFAHTMVSAMLGTELGEEITAQTMQVFLWVHPTVLTIVWAHEIILTTRVPAGEIDRGTMDVLLGLPVSRRAIYLAETAAWLVSGCALLAIGLLGHRAAAPAMPPEMRPSLSDSLLILVNLYCLYLAVGGVGLLVSAASNRRGRATAIVFALVVASFLLNFAAQFWAPAKQVAFLSVMTYYRPAAILQSSSLPVGDVAVLTSIAAVAWILGGEVLARRSVCTV